MTKTTRDNLDQAARMAGDLPGLLLKAEKIAHSFLRGVHGRRRVGQGETFWQFRNYQQGDARKDIDWRQTAKRDEPYIRQREWEASQALWLYRDATESMDFASSAKLQTKKDFAETLVLALGIVALNGGEQVALLGTDLAPQSHYNAIARLAEYLPHQKNLTEAARPVSANAQVALFSDFYMPFEQVSAFCARLAQRGVSGALVQICDPAEEDLAYSGHVRFHDPEDTGAMPITVPQVEAIRREYREKFLEHRRKISDMAASWGWRFDAVRTDEKPETVLNRLYHLLADQE